MLKNITVSAFADEAGQDRNVQIKALKDAGIKYLEVRGVDGKQFVNFTTAEAKEFAAQLAAEGIKIRSIGSPLGKIMITDDFAPHMEQFLHTLELAKAVNAEYIRLFSFYIPNDKRPEDYRDEVLARLSAFCEKAKGSGIKLCHENEKRIYGENAVRCAELLKELPLLYGVFDSANFIQCGQDIRQAWTLLKDRIIYLHVKDAEPSGAVVPAGKGIGLYKEILREFNARGGGNVTVEPHLKVFDGLKGLEKEGSTSDIGKYTYSSNVEAFAAAAQSLRSLLEEEE